MGEVSFKENRGTALNVTSANTTQTAADARGITVGGLFASGTNLAYTGSGTEKMPILRRLRCRAIRRS